MQNRMLSWFIGLSIRVQLLLLLLLVMVPSVAIIINSVVTKQTEQIMAARTDLRDIADFIVDDLQDIQFTAQQTGSMVAKTLAGREHNPSRLQRILADIVKINSSCSGIAVTDKSGTIIASYPRNDKIQSVAQRRSFRNAKATRLFSSGEYTSDKLSATTYFSFAYPRISRNGDFNGVIEIEISNRTFQSILKDTHFAPRSDFSIIDHTGIIIYSHLHPQFVGKLDRQKNFSLMQHGKESGDFQTIRGNDGLIRLAYFRNVHMEHEETSYVFLRVSKPTDSIAEMANRELLGYTLALGAISLAAFLLVGIIGKRSIADRVKSIETVATRLAEGSLDARVDSGIGGGEVGRLAGAINRMATQLEERNLQHEIMLDELRFKESKFESLFLLSQMTHEPEQAIKDFCLEEAVRTTGSAIGYIYFVNEDETMLTLHAWSKNVMDACQVVDKKTVYNLADIGLWGEAIRQRRPVITNDYSAPDAAKKGYPEGHVEIKRHMNIPLIIDGIIVLLAGVGNKGNDYGENDVRMLTLIMDGMWKLLDKKKFHEEREAFDKALITTNSKLQALNRNIENTREEERRTIARELHDQMGQTLTGLSLDLNWLAAQLDRHVSHKLTSHIVDMHITVETMIAMVQNITAKLSPPLFDNLGLSPAIGYYVKDFERKSGIVCHLMLDEGADEYLLVEDAMSVFRILQESLTNVARHAAAAEVAVSLCLTPHTIILEIADDGKGTTEKDISSPTAFGVLGMQERAHTCGGTLLILKNPGGGTIVRLEIPARKGNGDYESIGC